MTDDREFYTKTGQDSEKKKRTGSRPGPLDKLDGHGDSLPESLEGGTGTFDHPSSNTHSGFRGPSVEGPSDLPV